MLGGDSKSITLRTSWSVITLQEQLIMAGPGTNPPLVSPGLRTATSEFANYRHVSNNQSLGPVKAPASPKFSM